MNSVFQKNKNFIQISIFIYFINLILYSIFSFLEYPTIENIFWFLRIPILLFIYLVTGKKNSIYICSLILYQFASYFFAIGNPFFFMVGSFTSVAYKLSLLFLLLPLITKKDWLKVIFTCLPFFLCYLFLIELVAYSLKDTKIIWIFNALITSVIGGVAIIQYNKNDDLKGYWLVISSLLFIIQIGAFFINKFYIKSEAIYQMVILSYGLSHFAFYKYMILKENEV